MKTLPEKFKARMTLQLGEEAEAFFASYACEPSRGLRVNTLKISVADFLKISPFELAPSGTLDEGFVLCAPFDGIGNHPYHMAGLFYMQEPSAMAAIEALQIAPGMRVLDLCAAPGGKSGGIAARLGGSGLLVANELVPARAKTLAFTLERLGAANAAVTCAHPNALCDALSGCFDAVLVDAPCSGEGMFRKDDTAIDEWSPEHVEACTARQRAILQSAYAAVASGGTLVYSTCTFSREENEDMVLAFAAAHEDIEIEFMRRLYPHTCLGEGHFVARMHKRGVGRAQQQPLSFKPCSEAEYARFVEETFIEPPKGNAYILNDGRVLILREALPAGLAGVRMLNAGVYAGDMQRGRFVPAHSLFMAAHGGKVKNSVAFALGSAELAAYCAGNTLPVNDSLRGWCEVAANGYALGFGKAVDGTLKNHLPKGLRVG